MLTFTEFSKRLAQGQLKLHPIVADSDLGTIKAEKIDGLLSVTNQGLVDITTRMPVITKEIDLVFQTDQTKYSLVPGGVGTYLDESLTETFTDDFVKVLNLYDSEGIDHPIDTNGHIVTPVYNNLKFTAAKIIQLGAKVRIRYQAKHSIVTAVDTILLPPNLETALQLFVASLYHSHMNGADNTRKGDSYFAAYLRHMGEDESRNNSSTSEVEEDTRFSDRGFV